MRAQPGAGGHPSPHKAAGQLFPLYLVGLGPRVRVEVMSSDLVQNGHLPLVKSGHGQACTFPGEGEGLDGSSARQEADNVAPPAQEAPRVSEGSGLPRARPASTRGRLGWRLARTGERESPQMELGARWTPHAGPLPSLALLRGGLHALVFAIRKFSGPSAVLQLVPEKSKSLHLQRRA